MNLASVLGTGLFATVVKAQEVDTGVMCAIKVRKNLWSFGPYTAMIHEACSMTGYDLYCKSWRMILRLKLHCCLDQIIKPKVFIEYRDMLQTELLVWSAAGIHQNILRLKDVFISDTRMYFVSGELQVCN